MIAALETANDADVPGGFAQIGHDTKYISLPDNEDGYYSIFSVSFMTPVYAKEQERFTAKSSRARHLAKK
ncbi:MAG: hypothetical protein JSR50_11595 [Proteobacteria bacterium]|nr:hypothetical protein [Pseudomonadota bacterium]